VNKKMRYAIGAAGAVPALAMIPGQFAAPAAHAGKTAVTTGKKVRTVYATDMAVFTPTSIISSTSPNISQNNGTCSGSKGNHNTQNGITVRFYTKPEKGNRTCVGTIKVSDTGDLIQSIGGYVQNSHGVFCHFAKSGGGVTTDRCRGIFRNTNGAGTPQSLIVAGFSTSAIFGDVEHVKSFVPFKGNGF
jgi:hypothetical protein